MDWAVALYDVNRIALRNPRPSSGGSRPVNNDVAYALGLARAGITLGKFSAGLTEALDEAWSLTLRISRGEPMIRPATPETYPAIKSLRLSAGC
jgi:hypothetical protein